MSDLSTITHELAAQVREGRFRANLTQQELAAELGVSMRTVQNWEAGIGIPHPKHRRALVKFFSALEVAA